jgi:SpoVK/Ycf46/Vps4 family AAA+-type ATPase
MLQQIVAERNSPAGTRGGLSVLFTGPNAAAKRAAVEEIASALGQDVYHIDLSRIVTKYIGETEKNLNQVFAAAASTEAVLFLDEAEALFGKRTEVKDAHDRFANLEISYLLQRLETFQGIAILSTNTRPQIDGALSRQFSFIVEYC